MKRLLAIISAYFFICATVAAQIFHADSYNPIPPKREVRAVWLTTIGGLDWPKSYARTPRTIEKQKQELCDLLDRLQEANMNTVLLQTRIRGTVIYPPPMNHGTDACRAFQEHHQATTLLPTP